MTARLARLMRRLALGLGWGWAFVGAVHANLPASTDEQDLRRQIGVNVPALPAQMVASAWLNVGLGRTLLLRDEVSQAEVAFSTATSLAEKAGNASVGRRIEALRAVFRAIQKSKSDVMEAAKILNGAGTGELNAPTTAVDAINGIACYLRAEYDCAARHLALVLTAPAKRRDVLTHEDVFVLVRTAHHLNALGLHLEAARLLTAISGRFTPELSLAHQVVALNYLNDAPQVHPDAQRLAQELQEKIADWGGANVSKTNDPDEALVKQLSALKAAVAGVVIESQVRVGTVAGAAQEISRLNDYLVDEVPDDQRFDVPLRLWKLQQSLNRDASVQKRLTGIYSEIDVGNAYQQIAEARRLHLLAILYSGMSSQAAASTYADRLLNSAMRLGSIEVSRLAADTLLSIGRYNDAVPLYAEILTPRIELASRMQLQEPSLATDAFHLAEAALSSPDRAISAQALNLLRRLAAAKVGAPVLKLMTDALAAVTGADARTALANVSRLVAVAMREFANERESVVWAVLTRTRDADVELREYLRAVDLGIDLADSGAEAQQVRNAYRWYAVGQALRRGDAAIANQYRRQIHTTGMNATQIRLASVRGAIVESRLQMLGGDAEASVRALCSAREIYAQLGNPMPYVLPPTRDEAAILSTQSRTSRAPCVARSGLSLDEIVESAVRARNPLEAVPVLDEEDVDAFVRKEGRSIAALETFEQRRDAVQRLLSKLLQAGLKTAAHQQALSRLLEVFDELGMPFDGAALIVAASSSLVIEDQRSVREIRVAAADRIVAAFASGVLQGAEQSPHWTTLAGISRHPAVPKAALKKNLEGQAASLTTRWRPGAIGSAESLEYAARSLARRHAQVAGTAEAAHLCDLGPTGVEGKALAVPVPVSDRSRSREVSLIYRKAQILLLCGKGAEAAAQFDSLPTRLKPNDQRRYLPRYTVWWIQDLQQVGDLASVQAKLVGLMEFLRTWPSDYELPIGTAREMFLRLSQVQSPNAAHDFADAILRQRCASPSSLCREMGYLRARHIASAAYAAGGATEAVLALHRSAFSPDTAAGAATVLAEEALRTLKAGDRSAASSIVRNAIVPLEARFPHLNRSRRLQPVIAWSQVCLNNEGDALRRAQAIATIEGGLDNERLEDALTLFVVEKAMRQRGMSQVWRGALLPTVETAAQSRTVPIEQRIDALFDSGYELLALKAMQESEVWSLQGDDLNGLIQKATSYLLGLQDRVLLGELLPILTAIDQRLTVATIAPQQAGLIKRFVAEAAYVKQNRPLALRKILEAYGVELGAHRAAPSTGRPAATAFEVVKAFGTEDLLQIAIGRDADGATTTASRGPQASGQGAEWRLRHSQRALLAQLLINGEPPAIGSQAERRDFGFKAIQAATTGVTAVEMGVSQLRSLFNDAKLEKTFLTMIRRTQTSNRYLAPIWVPDVQDERAELYSMMQSGCPASGGAPLHLARFPASPAVQGEKDTRIHSPMDDMQEALDGDESTMQFDSQAEVEVVSFLEKKNRSMKELADPIALPVLQARLQADAGVFFAASGPAGTHVFLVTKQQVFASEATLAGQALGAARLTELVEALRTAISGRTGFDRSLASNLFDALFGSFTVPLRSLHELSIVPQGPLENLPFGVLLAPSVGYRGDATDRETVREWFDDRFAWRFALAANQQGQAADAPLRRTSMKPKVFQFGPPSFSGKLPQCANLSALLEPGKHTLQEELCDISDLASLATTAINESSTFSFPIVAQGSSASLQTLQAWSRSGQLDSAAVLIIATHGLLPHEAARANAPREPAIVLSNGVLTSTEIGALQIGATEVVLAACNSASAMENSGEQAFSGLVRAVLRGGAQNVVAAMFSVPVDATQIVLTEYFARRSEGASGAKAMQAAKRALRNKGDIFTPFDWSGLVQIGTY